MYFKISQIDKEFIASATFKFLVFVNSFCVIIQSPLTTKWFVTFVTIDDIGLGEYLFMDISVMKLQGFDCKVDFIANVTCEFFSLFMNSTNMVDAILLLRKQLSTILAAEIFNTLMDISMMYLKTSVLAKLFPTNLAIYFFSFMHNGMMKL